MCCIRSLLHDPVNPGPAARCTVAGERARRYPMAWCTSEWTRQLSVNLRRWVSGWLEAFPARRRIEVSKIVRNQIINIIIVLIGIVLIFMGIGALITAYTEQWTAGMDFVYGYIPLIIGLSIIIAIFLYNWMFK